MYSHVFESSSILILVGACRLRVVSKLPKIFPTPADAERHYYERGTIENEPHDVPMTADILSAQASTQTDFCVHDVGTQTEECEMDLYEVVQKVSKLAPPAQEKLISQQFGMLASEFYGVHISQDFVELALRASQHLLKSGRSNVLYALAKALERMRIDGSDSRFPAKRMPMGLLEHMANFFNAESYSQVRVCMYCIIVTYMYLYIPSPRLESVQMTIGTG